jgi:hypothetical protein
MDADAFRSASGSTVSASSSVDVCFLFVERHYLRIHIVELVKVPRRPGRAVT